VAKPSMNRDYPPSMKRYAQLERVLVLVEIMQQLRRPARLDTLHEEVQERLGVKYSWRTILRDLQFLELAGYVNHASPRPGHGWEWRMDRPLLRVTPEAIDNVRAARERVAKEATPYWKRRQYRKESA
jgi:hypothetical protein